MPTTLSPLPSSLAIQAITQEMAEGSGSVLLNHPTQSAVSIDGWKSLLFGSPFLFIGLWLEAVALQLVTNHGKHAPNLFIGMVGGFFFIAGAFLVLHGLRGLIRKAAYRRDFARDPGEPWYADHHWHKEGVGFSAFKSMLNRFVAALGWNAFLIPFFWVGFTQRGAWPFILIASLFALIGLIFWARWAQMLAELLRYGNSFLQYDQFPFFLGNTINARLRIPHHLADLDELKLTFRCVQEKYVVTGVGKNRSSQVVCYELYKNELTIPRDRLASFASGDIPVQFSIPSSQPPTTLVATPPTYWELEANGSSSKVNYQAFFLLPIYKS